MGAVEHVFSSGTITFKLTPQTFEFTVNQLSVYLINYVFQLYLINIAEQLKIVLYMDGCCCS